MGRAKPFSQAQKKKQLQEKREQKRLQKERDSNWDWNDAGPRTAAESSQQQERNQPRSDQRRTLVSQFQRLTAEELEERKQKSRLPIVNVPLESQRMSYDQIYPEDGIIQIPVRPHWDYSMSKEDLENNELAEFDKWLTGIETKYPTEKLSYFEKNLEVWRQLWRTVEMSDILVVVTDARFPILHFPPSLYHYITQKVRKPLIVLMNKIDLVPKEVAEEWKAYMLSKFPELHIIQSCSYSQEQIETMNNSETKKKYQRPNYAKSMGVVHILECCKRIAAGLPGKPSVDWTSIIRDRLDQFDDEQNLEEFQDNFDEDSEYEHEEMPSTPHEQETDEQDFRKSSKRQPYITLGMIGHPNVGKSTVVNALVGKKMVSVSKTPGHTKHFQTIFLAKDLRLCDCPGLVFPSLISKQLQVLCGVFNVAQVQEPYTSIQYLAERVPVPDILDLQLPTDEDPNTTKWSAYEICRAYAMKRGFLTSKAGRPDVYRAANLILRMAIDGRQLPFYLRPKLAK